MTNKKRTESDSLGIKKIDSKKIFLKLFEIGSFYKWNSSKEISLIIEDLEGSEKSLIYLNNIK